MATYGIAKAMRRDEPETRLDTKLRDTLRRTFARKCLKTRRPEEDGRRSVEEGDRLHGRDVEALPATHVLAHHDVVFAEHVGAGLGEACTVALIGARGKVFLLGTNQPVDLVLRRLMAMRAVEVGGLLVGPLVEKFAFFHTSLRSSVLGRQRRRGPDRPSELLHKVAGPRDYSAGFALDSGRPQLWRKRRRFNDFGR